jgi:hypothetical protein
VSSNSFISCIFPEPETVQVRFPESGGEILSGQNHLQVFSDRLFSGQGNSDIPKSISDSYREFQRYTDEVSTPMRGHNSYGGGI